MTNDETPTDETPIDETPTNGGPAAGASDRRAGTPPAAAPAAVPPRLSRRGPDMEKHVTLLGALHLATAAVLLMIALFVFVLMTGSGLASRDPDAIAVTTLIGIGVGAFLFVVALPGLVAGWGLIRRRRWARVLALIVGAMNLLNVPFGTALGVYTIWVLMQDDTVAILEGGRRGPSGT